MILVLSGVSGSGKTSACLIAERMAVVAGIAVGGVLCRAVFEGGRKVGIDVRNLAGGLDGPAAPFARARLGAPSAPPPTGKPAPAFDDADPLVLRYGMWEFSRAAISAADEATASFLAAVRAADDGTRRATTRFLAIVDEIGPMELDRGAGMTRTLAELDAEAAAPSGALGCLVVARPDIADRLAIRWSASKRLAIDGLSYREAAETAIAAFEYRDPLLRGGYRDGGDGPAVLAV
ncbi:MAG: hypothetical protein CVV47_16060 [Spirochaetae bacterium HGW-Spirochaetae-3]|jgi:hypothetical protein|nr:MAG: hypothetical protein CVV47_16060 [Spirochaetae bacterium HGW-Spirochaetae-3]